MYGFISGAVNNDVGVNAGAAALELLLIRCCAAAMTLALGTADGRRCWSRCRSSRERRSRCIRSPGSRCLATLWRHHRRSDARGWVALALGAVAVRELSWHCSGVLPAGLGRRGGVGTLRSEAGTAALGQRSARHPLDYLCYLWQVAAAAAAVHDRALPHQRALPRAS